MELRGQALATSRLAPRRVRQHPARTEDERADLVGVPHLAFPQPFDRHEQHLLREIVRGRLVAQVLQAVQSHPRCESAIQLRLFGLRLAGRRRRDGSGELTIARSRRTSVRAPVHECDANSRPRRRSSRSCPWRAAGFSDWVGVARDRSSSAGPLTQLTSQPESTVMNTSASSEAPCLVVHAGGKVVEAARARARAAGPRARRRTCPRSPYGSRSRCASASGRASPSAMRISSWVACVFGSTRRIDTCGESAPNSGTIGCHFRSSYGTPIACCRLSPAWLCAPDGAAPTTCWKGKGNEKCKSLWDLSHIVCASL